MLISSKGRYALRLMIYIAALGDAEGKIALREIADREHISAKVTDGVLEVEIPKLTPKEEAKTTKKIEVK